MTPNRVKKTLQFTTIAQQLKAFESIGWGAISGVKQMAEIGEEFELFVHVGTENRNYHFSDPNLDVIISQLANLYCNIKERELQK